MTLQKRIDVPRIIVAGFLAGFAVFVVSWGFSFLVQYFLGYDVLALGGMRRIDDPVMALFFLYPWVVGYSMAVVYPFFTKVVSCEPCKPKVFGAVVWILAYVPQIFMVFATMDYPAGFYVNQVVGSFIYVMVAAYVIGRLLA